MTDDKVRRVSLFPGDGVYGNYYEDDPNGTHHLAPVAEYVPVRREVWERLTKIAEEHAAHGRRYFQGDPCQCGFCCALAEIGDGDGV